MAEANAGRVPAGLWFSLTAAFLSAIVLSTIGSAWAVVHVMSGGTRLSATQERYVLWIANLPPMLRQVFVQLTTPAESTFLLQRRLVEQPSWVRRFPAAEDAGFLLFSGVDARTPQPLVKLLRIADGALIAQWRPDWREIQVRTARTNYNVMQAVHPLLLDDGDIIFNTGRSLVRQGPCSSKPVWVLDEPMHHSVEADGLGNLWVPAIAHEEFADNPWLQRHFRDDALARVSLDGKLLEKRSFARILRENHLQVMVLGMAGHRFNADPIHLNQIAVAPSDTAYWRRGDLLLSTRNLSTVFLYRPATGKILWYQTGPWLNQHSVDFIDDHRISVFDNHVVSGAPPNQPFAIPGDINRVVIFDFATGQTLEPYAALLAQARPISAGQGRARVLPDGGLFIEETDAGRHLRFSPSALLWARVNDYDETQIGMVAWSRYLTAAEASTPLAALAAHRCTAAAPSKPE